MKRKPPGQRQGKRTVKEGARDVGVERQLVTVDLSTPEAKARMKAHLTSNPGYEAFIKRLVHVAQTWRLFNSTAVLEWQDADGTLMTGSLGDPYVQGYLAKSEAAFELLRYMDEETGRQASLLQANFALGIAGLLKQRRTTRMKSQKCPHCGVEVDMQTDYFNRATPKKGDITVCVGCAGMSRFGPELELGVLSDEELSTFPQSVRQRLEAMRKAVLEMREQKP